MCGRFVQKSSANQMQSFFSIKGPVPNFGPRYNVAPTQDAAVVLAEDATTRRLALKKWGLIPAWSKEGKASYATFNARAESVREKPSYAQPFAKRRCIVPADGFYEWTGPKGAKIPHLFERQDGALPMRADIEPADIKSLLPFVIIVDLQADPFRVFYRLVGTAVVHASGMDFTGTYLDELAFDICATPDLIRAYRAVSESRWPGLGMAFAQITHQTALDVEYLICPLGDAEGAVRQCLVIEDYVAKEGFESGKLRLARPV